MIDRYQLTMGLSQAVPVLFVFAFGACVGSLINVLVYRMPKGISVVFPPSRCPSCQTRLRWYDNVPIFGWYKLRGRCRYCGSKISPEYPIVEAFVALLFVLFYVLWYTVPDSASWLGVGWGRVKPEWAMNGLATTWPTFVVLLTLLGCLVTCTLIDAKTYTIPLELTWVPVVVAVVVHPVHAAWVVRDGGEGLRHTAGRFLWTLPTPGPDGWLWIGAALGATLGLAIGIVLLRFGLIRRSFADYDEWEKKALADHPGEAGADAPADLWIQYPHARREVLKELVYLAPCLGLGVFGAGMLPRLVPAGSQAPLWLSVLAGVLLGYLVGGGVVWAVRIFGSLAFGKEAMGLGDVHLMAAVGACLGWIDPTIAFFAAAFIGVFWAILGAVFGGALKRAMPYGPFLAAATILVLLTKPVLESGLSRIISAASPIDLP